MPSDNYLTLEEILKAITLAETFRDQEVEGSMVRASEEKIDDCAPFLSKAVFEVRADKSRSRAKTLRRRVAVAASVIALVLAYVALTPRLHRSLTAPPANAQRSADVHVSAPATKTVVFPPSGDRLLSGLPAPSAQVPIIEPLNLAKSSTLGDLASIPLTFDSEDATAVTFINKRNSPVLLNWTKNTWTYSPYVILRPGQTLWVPAVWGDCIVATETSGRFIAMYYPPGIPTTAVITETTGTTKDGPLHGYLLLSSPETLHLHTLTAQPTSQDQSEPVSTFYQSDSIMAFNLYVQNFSSDLVNLYFANANGTSNFIQQLGPGASWGGATCPGCSYPITDKHQHVLGTFSNPPVDRFAVILPKHG